MWEDSLLMDDQLWAQTMLTDRLLTECHVDCINQNESLPVEERGLVRLLSLGTLDRSVQDRPWDVSTRSMRYTAATSSRLWMMLVNKRDRVRRWPVQSLLFGLTLSIFRVIIWNESCSDSGESRPRSRS